MKNIYKYASLLLAAAIAFSCQSPVNDETGENGENNGGGAPGKKTLTITSDRNLIQTFGGDYANLTVSLNGEPVTEELVFYRDVDKSSVVLSDVTSPVRVEGSKLYADAVGEYVIWANYGTYISDKVTVKAIDIEIPSTPTDPSPESTDFKARVLLTEFTTVGCTACPSMKSALHTLEQDNKMIDKYVLVECHSGLVNQVPDPCFLYNNNFESWSQITGFPTVKVNLVNTLIDRTAIKSVVDEYVEAQEEVAPGIAVNANLEDDKVVAKVTVKAKVDGTYRVGAFLLEDGIYAVQYGSNVEEYMNTHNNVIRYVDAEYKSNFYGYPVADIQAGKTADAMFSWILDEIWTNGSKKSEINGQTPWPERDNSRLEMAVFVCASDGRGGYDLVNSIICPISGETPYQYK